MKKIAIIGSGFSSLSAACYLAQAGNDVTIFEKNEAIGGRASQFKKDGFCFDMGPTFYWMPDVFDRFFTDFNRKRSDYYELSRLDPGYKVYFEKDDAIDISVNLEMLYKAFEKEEPGSSKFLKKFLSMAEFNYNAAMDEVIYRPGKSPLELVTFATASRLNQFVTSISKTIRKNVTSERLIKILEFPVIFLGAKPQNIPTFYCFMNYADMILGTWHPKGGFYKVIEGIGKLAIELGVQIKTNASVQKIEVDKNKATGLIVNKEFLAFDAIVSGADYHHTETLLDAPYKNYNEKYWEKKTFAPSALLFFVGFNKKLKNLNHHTLFFDTDFDKHIDTIYGDPSWPKDPLFYTSFPSITDNTMAPDGKEAGIFLIPLAPGLEDSNSIREKYFNQIIKRIEKITDQSLIDTILFKKSFGVSDFVTDYNAYKGNAYGLANTLMQTAFLKPKMENKIVRNLVYTGQLTVPGPGVPTTIISGKIAADLTLKKFKNK
ncbi:phytoene desaturase [Aurantibacter crassamenti]|uniref:phytoene desaturase family protein n=1 Tax=Aurantibacter crassamenti TaxID=1837375 RepID=UPI00193AA52D|nr:phytoene desaturase family protein [Aurantibacter crassamenti]MBM1107022.1 phytoene desaturase [Aurantibacter crassamenti]